MEFLSHTPPSLPDGSLKASSWKRGRWGGRDRAPSISGRLRSASDLVEGGVISDLQKGTLKDMIISNDPRVDEALRMADDGNFSQLQEVLRAAQDKPRNSSMDLVNDLGLEQLDLGFFDVGGSGVKPSPPASHRSSSPPPSETSASGGAQFQFDDDMWDILDTAAGNDGMMSTSVGNDSHMAMSWDGRGNDRMSGGGLSGMGSLGGGSGGHGGHGGVGRQRLPSQSGSFSTFFGMTPPMDSTLEMYGNSPNSALAMSMDKSTTDALTGGRGSGGSGAFSKTSNGSVSINLQSGLSKMMSKAPAGGIAASGIGKNLQASAPMAMPKRAETPVQIGPDGKPIKKMVGDYSPESRRARIARYATTYDAVDDVWDDCCDLLLSERNSDVSLSLSLSLSLSSSPSTYSSSSYFFPFPFSLPISLPTNE